MTTTFWSVLAIAIVAAAVYGLWLAGLFRRSRELDRKIDYSKMRVWRDDGE